MSTTTGSVASPEPIFDDSRKRLKHHAAVLREYAKWSLLRGYQFAPSKESHRDELIKQFFTLGATVGLTKRDMVLLLYRGLFQKPSYLDRLD